MAETAASIEGVESVSYVDNAALAKGIAEEWTPLVLQAQKAGRHSHIVAAASAFSKSMLPRVAAKLGVAQISDVLEVKGDSTFVRPMYAGNALATVESSDAVKVLTVRPTSFDTAARTGGSATVAAFSEAPASSGQVQWISESVVKSDRPELATSKMVTHTATPGPVARFGVQPTLPPARWWRVVAASKPPNTLPRAAFSTHSL